MIGMGKSIAHTRASIGYGMKEEKEAELVFKQELTGETPNEITQEFKAIQELNHNCQNNTLSFVLSPTIEDGKNLSKKRLNQICKNFIKEMKLKDRQAIAFVHRSKEHTHIHVYVNRIDYKGVAYNDSFIGKNSQVAAERVAEKMHLTTVKQVRLEKEFNLREIRTEMKRRHDLTIKQFKPKGLRAYMEGMKANGIQVVPCINKANKLQGFRFEFKEHNLKGSEIHRSMSGSKLGKQIDLNTDLAKFMNQHAKPEIALNTAKELMLNTKIPVKVLKMAIKRIINKGLDTGMGI